MTDLYKGCQHAGCNAPEGECDGACLRKQEEELQRVKCPGCGGAWTFDGGADWIKCTCGASYDPRTFERTKSASEPERTTVGDFVKTDECLRIKLASLGFGSPAVPPNEIWAILGNQVVGKVTGVAKALPPTDPFPEEPPRRRPQEAIDDPLMCEILGFLNDLTHPEQYGYAVTAEVRKRARELAAAIEVSEGMP